MCIPRTFVNLTCFILLPCIMINCKVKVSSYIAQYTLLLTGKNLRNLLKNRFTNVMLAEIVNYGALSPRYKSIIYRVGTIWQAGNLAS